MADEVAVEKLKNLKEVGAVVKLAVEEVIKIKQGGKVNAETVGTLIGDLMKADAFNLVVSAIKSIDEIPSELKGEFSGFEGSAGAKVKFVGEKLKQLGDLLIASEGTLDALFPAKKAEA